MSLAALKWAAKQRTGSKSSNLVLRTLADAANERGACFLSQQIIAERAECSVSTVYRSLRELKASGLLTCVQRRTARGYRSSDLLTLAIKARPDAVQPVNLTARNERLPVKLTEPTGQIDGARVNQCSNHKREEATEQQAPSLSKPPTIERLPDDWTPSGRMAPFYAHPLRGHRRSNRQVGAAVPHPLPGPRPSGRCGSTMSWWARRISAPLSTRSPPRQIT